jgi:hypothetical protein
VQVIYSLFITALHNRFFFDYRGKSNVQFNAVATRLPVKRNSVKDESDHTSKRQRKEELVGNSNGEKYNTSDNPTSYTASIEVCTEIIVESE